MSRSRDHIPGVRRHVLRRSPTSAGRVKMVAMKRGGAIGARVGGIVFDCADPRTVARFWRDATGLHVRHDPGEPEDPDRWPDEAEWIGLFDPAGRAPELGFQRVPEGKVAKNRVHIDLHSPDEEAEAERLKGLGAEELWRSTDPEDPFIVLADPEGNEFCVVRAGQPADRGDVALIEFPADDPTRARRFWEEILGMETRPRRPQEGSGWQTDPAAGPALGLHERGTGPGDRVSLPYFEVPDLATALERIERAGGEVIHPGERWAICRDSEGSPFGLIQIP